MASAAIRGAGPGIMVFLAPMVILWHMRAEQERLAMFGLVVGDNPGRVWGFSSRGRSERLLDQAGLEVLASADRIPDENSILVLNADYVFEAAFVKRLAEGGAIVVEDDGEETRPVAAAVLAAPQARRIAAAIPSGRPDYEDLGVAPTRLSEMPPLYHKALRKRSEHLLYSLARRPVRRIEWLLYKAAYKGVTDFMTKYAWPVPAFWLTKACQVLGISPNVVTTVSLGLVILATYLFWIGDFALGLVAAWSMCILDTVDGKLARVTMRSSKWGEAYDHGIDIIHPPFWYFAWAMGLAAWTGAGLGTDTALHLSIIIGGYILGRLAEGLFMLMADGTEMWIWRPIDSFVRLFVARRNPNLVLMSIAFALGNPAAGLVAVSLWTLFSLAYQVARILGLMVMKKRRQAIHSWLSAA